MRHRLPRLWERVLAGEVYAWKAREIARATAHLNVFTARIVDKLLHDQVELVAWTRFVKILDATLLQVDPTTYGERQAKAAAQRDVKATQSSDGLRTLVARGTSGDVTMFLALVDAIAQALADEGDEDPYPVRKSKAIGIAAYPDRAQDLLSRGRHREDPTKDPWEQVDAHQADPTDPWADDLPAAGWETARHGNYHQPGLDEEWEMPGAVPTDDDDQQDEDLVDHTDLAWYHQHTWRGATTWHTTSPVKSDEAGMGDAPDPPPASEPSGTTSDSVPAVSTSAHATRPFEVPTDGAPAHARQRPDRPRRPRCRAHASTDRSPSTSFATSSATAARPSRSIRSTIPPTPPRSTTTRSQSPSADPSRSRTPPRSSRSALRTGRMDLDHTAAYEPDGPPGQTSMANLGPLTRSEHRAKTVGGWRAKQPDPGLYVWRSPEGRDRPSPPTKAPLCSAAPPTPTTSGAPPARRREGCAVVGSAPASRALADCVRHGGAEPEGCRHDPFPVLPA